LQDDIAKTRGLAAANEALQKQVADLQAQLSKLQQQMDAQNRRPAPKPVEEKSSWLLTLAPAPSPAGAITQQHNPNERKEMTHITVPLPDDVAKTYYEAAQKLSDHLAEIGQSPSPQTLMRFVLASYTADEIASQFDLALRNFVGAPIPDEPDVCVFSPEFENVSA
jgi:hypothetical protein